jgi:spore maturation protein CgeB
MNIGISDSESSILIVGGTGLTQVGQAFFQSAQDLRMKAWQLDTAAAYQGNRLLRALSWRLFGHKPLRLRAFSNLVLQHCQAQRPSVLLSTGAAPISADVLLQAKKLGVVCANFSTDDPFSKSNGAHFFNESLKHYDWVFTPRRANMDELRAVCKNVRYLPFGFDAAHCVGDAIDGVTMRKLHSQVLIVGGADRERIPIAKSVVQAGFELALYGSYWDRDVSLRSFARGHAAPEVLRQATLAADIVLCLVRRANRDGHVMRSFEAAATGACLLVEDTPEHRDIFGLEGENVAYFGSETQMLTRIRELLAAPQERARLSASVKKSIQAGRHTYTDRLQSLLSIMNDSNS